MKWHGRKRNKLFYCVLTVLCLLCLIRISMTERPEQQSKKIDTVLSYLSNTIQEQIIKTYLPSLSYTAEYGSDDESFMQKTLYVRAPLLEYVGMQADYETQIEDAVTEQKILEQEANDERDLLWEALINENAAATSIESDRLPKDETKIQEPSVSDNTYSQDSNTEQHKEINMEELKDFDSLVTKFYAIDKSTSIDENQLNLEMLLKKDISMQNGKAGGSILIYHTHSQEGYSNSIMGDLSTTVVGVGEQLCERLREYGYTVIHDTGIYDLEDRNYAYAKAGEAIEQILEQHPEIEVIIDLHRDGVSNTRKLVTEINGVQTAQIMFFNGLSRTTTLGDISYLQNPYIEDNLSFTFWLQLSAEKYYPTLTRKIYLKGYRYNLHYRPKSLLVEVGAQTNSLEEAIAAMNPLADILDKVLDPSEEEHIYYYEENSEDTQ